MITHPEYIRASDVARMMARHGIQRERLDTVQGNRYTLCQDGQEIYYEHAEQQEAAEPKRGGWRDKARRESE